jgi:DNA-binding LacI/PurR family transcriptional regulator/anti-anti-sigma regulatory factor
MQLYSLVQDISLKEGFRMTERIRTVGFTALYTGGSYYGAILEGVYRSAQRHSVRMVAVQYQADAPLPDALGLDVIDGWIVVLDDARIAQLARSGRPVVGISSSPGQPMVQPDNYGGMHAAVRHLIAHGHQRIAFVGPPDNSDVPMRLRGYTAALADAGIAFDPELIINTADELEAAGAAGARALIERSIQCTAAAIAIDRNAFGFMKTMQAAGVRIPEDMAITGFDDMVEAQTCTPPLTTVRQRFDSLGMAALDLLLDLIGGAAPPNEPQGVITPLIVRRSCGCDRSLNSVVHLGDDESDQALRNRLANDLVSLLLYPLPFDPAQSPLEIWPTLTTLIASLDATLAGQTLPSIDDITQAWRQATDIVIDIDVLNAVMDQLEWTGFRLAKAQGAAIAARMVDTLQLLRKEFVRARVAVESAQVSYMSRVMTANNNMSTFLLRAENLSRPSLDWMQFTQARWGCLGLWKEEGDSLLIELAEVYDSDGNAPVAVGQRIALANFPPLDDLSSVTPATHFSRTQVLPLCTNQRNWGVLVLSGNLQTITGAVGDPVDIWIEMMGGALDRSALLGKVQSQQQQLQQAYERERGLASTVREIGSPVIPLLPGVLLIPLIGAIDIERANHVITSVLDALKDHSANHVLIDITGVPIIDTHVATMLIQLGQMARLLGARSTLVGVRPEIAQSIVGLGIDLTAIDTHATLAAALNTLLKARGLLQ